MALDRRGLLTGLAALSVGRAGTEAAAQDAPHREPPSGPVPLPAGAAGAEVIPLWPGLPPGGGGPDPSDPYDQSREGVVTAVARPCLIALRPARPNGAAVVVAAGGGYRRIDVGHEGVPVALWLTSLGITAFVLVYRLPGEGWGAAADAPFQDAQRALRLVRARAGRYGLDPARIGSMGFSAGGHLMGWASACFGKTVYEPVDEDDAVSARPDLSALIYPVITLKAPFDRTSSRRVLVGERPTPVATATYSVEPHVRGTTPPTFLAQAADDPVAVVDNCLLMFSALRAVDVPTEMHLFEKGGHGFNLGVPGSPAAAWPGLFATWARRRGFLRG
ncbi:alpha/beta hydrolase [uncultured Methylobacterium sp.]|jgi:acetyl esterase/lipase|uniref:alpha/beta hydrolase n=1 Tax=uncultured Methylobacterium sp. TaxID=157278 RepID=UPI00263271A9|nr:alpha/beta hydrolase [uncultured Methylobacterium sp.]